MIDAPTFKNSTTVRSEIALWGIRGAVKAAFSLSDNWGASLAERLFTTPRRHHRPPREQAVIATGHRFEIEFVRHAPRWNGQKAKVVAWRWGYGPAVLLVHGWEGR